MTILPPEQIPYPSHTYNSRNASFDSSFQQPEVENARLRMIIGELLTKNQNLRWQLQSHLAGRDLSGAGPRGQQAHRLPDIIYLPES